MASLYKRIILAFFIGLFPVAIRAQPSLAPKQTIEIGDKMPDYNFVNLINYKTKTAQLSNFAGKLLILDYWSTSCASCIASWPKLLKLQETFADKIQIMLVNIHEDESIVRGVMDRQLKLNNVNMTLPSVCGDTVLYHLMPYRGVPHVVWIDQNGYLRSVTYGSELRAELIQSILNKEPIKVNQKLPPKTFSYYYDQSKLKDVRSPLFINGNGEAGKFIPFVTQSVLTGKIEGVRNISIWQRTDSIHSILTVGNVSINTMYKVAFNDNGFKDDPYSQVDYLNDNRVIFNVTNPKFFEEESSGRVNREYFYYYQLTTSPTTKRRLQRMFQLDLEKYFGLEARLEKRKTKCLVLAAIDTTLMKYNGSEKWPVFNDNGETVWHNWPLPQLVNHLSNSEYYSSPYPIVDETDYTGNVGGFEILNDHVAFNDVLLKHGMKFTLEDREIDFLVVTEPDGWVFPEDLEYLTEFGVIDWVYEN